MATTLFRGPVLQGKKNEGSVSGFNIEEKASNYTVVISTDSGKTLLSKTKDVVFTLPAIAIGNVFTFVNTAEDGTNNLTISPNASDGITYKGSSTDDKDLINTQSTSKVGDYVTIASLDGTTAWQVVDAQGVWAKES
jgi:hypothetical protein|tara:strand:- start:978 stop:1388 length:411 start_codon:yes stop_codon:yes gene_type:complete